MSLAIITPMAVAFFVTGLLIFLHSIFMDLRLLLKDDANRRNHEYFATFIVVLLVAACFMILGIGIKLFFP